MPHEIAKPPLLIPDSLLLAIEFDECRIALPASAPMLRILGRHLRELS